MAAVILTLLGLLLPTQLGLHLWPSWSYVYGLRIDYLSPTIYLTDLLLLVVLLINFKRLFNFTYRHLLIFLILGIFIFLNIVFSVTPPITVISWFRVLLLFNLTNYLINQPINRFDYLFLGLAAGVIVVSSLALSEFASQKSINGIFYWLGERRFDITTPGISRLVLPNILLLRPYSTFGHPNVLGGFTLISYLLLLRVQNQKSNLLVRLAIPFAILAIFLSFSKAVIFTLALITLFKILQLRTKPIVLFSLVISLILMILPIFITSLTFGRSLIDRNFLLTEAFEVIKHFPILGVGLGNFIPAQSSLNLGTQGSFIYLQPVHNIFILLLSEIGVIGIVFLCLLLFSLRSTIYKLPGTVWYLLTAVLLTGSADHYWLTLQQPRLLLAVVLGLILKHDIYKKRLL